MFLTNICELRGTHQNSGHSHYNNELRHQNIESKKKKTMHAKLHYISKKIYGKDIVSGDKEGQLPSCVEFGMLILYLLNL